MEDIEEHILRINVHTDKLTMDSIQEVIKKIKKVQDNQKHNDEFRKHCAQILDSLWLHLDTGFKEFDDQLLCSTYFYTILTFSSDKEYYFNLILKVIDYELNFKEKGTEVSRTMFKTISLMYGIFQSPLLQKSKDSILKSILNKIFTLLTLLAYEYSQYTFIVFKIMTFFKKIISTYFQETIFNRNCNLKLLNVINHNWENPINGVRSLNKIVFQNLILIVDKEMHGFILQELNGFYWNKAKYFMFSEIIEMYQGCIKTLVLKYNLIDGLVYSLHKAGLVSAGADMYITIVKKISTDDDWCAIFLNIIIEIFNGVSIKAIDNFNNYWCLNTLKLFPSLTKTIFNEIEKRSSAKHKLYSGLSLMQQGNRLGLEKTLNCNVIEEFVLNGVEHIDPCIRTLSFDIVCNSHTKFLKSQNEYDLILNYLRNNINSDCSVLRINMIKNLQKFLTQEHNVFVNYIQNSNNCDVTTNFQGFLSFCTELQNFIVESLNFNGNYQRKVATIQITKALLNCYQGVLRKKHKHKTVQTNTILMDFLNKGNYWILSEEQFVMKLISLLKDPSDDIREHVVDVLLNNYSDELCNNELIEYLTLEALSCIRNRFFYQNVCGQTMFKLIVNLLIKKTCTSGQFRTVEDVFEFAYGVLKSECNLKVDIVKSINEGKQLYTYLSILYTIYEVCLDKTHSLNISIDVVNSLIEILEIISNQFEQEEASGSSDFSKINDMVQDMIVNSEHQICNQHDEANMSGLQQIVLNCMWLNVKASCQLSSVLIKYYNDDTHIHICEKCLKIICHVLETSRHKGAIEAGGTTLGQAIQQLTSSTEGCGISKIPMMLLKCKLNELISETSNMASVTRRGAGLSIMIHRIVSSDMKKGKPLFHYFMQVLLKTFNKLPETSNNENDTGNEKDLPKAIYIHFLTRIVIDSSLASDVLYYSATLAEVAFDNLASPIWQIRNAALQLYGSLIPKLIGQKKNSGASEEVISTVAVDEFRTHSPKLWEYIVTQLKDTTELSDTVQSHNNLVPIISILANMAPMYSFTYEKYINEALLPNLQSLLGSPIYVVRRLTAKCVLNLYPFEVISEVLLNSTCDTENCLHGTLMLLNDFFKQYKERNDLKEKSHVLYYKYYNMLTARNHSYLCKERFESIFPECINLTDSMIRETLLEVHANKKTYAQGIFLWANFRVQKYLENISWCTILDIVKVIADCSEFDIYCGTLCKRIQAEESIPEKVLLDLSIILFSMAFKTKSTIIWKIMYEISLKTELLCMHLDVSMLHRYLLDNELSYGMRYMLPFAARIFTKTAAESFLLLSNIIFKLCSPDIADTEIRLVAAMANNELANKLNILPGLAKVNTIKSAVMFLQDEDEDVRNCSAQFYRLVNKDKREKHPYICLQKVLSPDFLYMVFEHSSSDIQSIRIDLINLLKTLTMYNEEEYNPFANESKNIYLEQEVLKQLLGKLNTD